MKKKSTHYLKVAISKSTYLWGLINKLITRLIDFLKQISTLTWKSIIVAGAILTLITGFLAVHDRWFNSDASINIKEYVFGSQYYWVQALVDDTDKVVAFGVTVRSKDFQPKFTILRGLYYVTDKVDPTDQSKWVSGEKNIILGKTTFSDLNEIPDDIVYLEGFHDFYYHEEYYFGNPELYQSIFLAVNAGGYYEYEFEPFNIIKYREVEPINTFYITAPKVGLNNASIRKYLIGVDYDQVRAIPESAFRNNKPLSQQIKDVQSLSSSVTLESFKKILGEPLVINNHPINSVRTDVTVEERWNDAHGPFMIKICKIDYLSQLPLLKRFCIERLLDWYIKYQSGNLPNNIVFTNP